MALFFRVWPGDSLATTFCWITICKQQTDATWWSGLPMSKKVGIGAWLVGTFLIDENKSQDVAWLRQMH